MTLVRVLFPVVLLGIAVANLASMPTVLQGRGFMDLTPQGGRSLQNRQRAIPGTMDRSWYLYGIVERHFKGWTLIAYADEPARFSRMYKYNYGGIGKLTVARFDPEISAGEVNGLLSQRHVTDTVGRLGGAVYIILPEPESEPGKLYLLRRDDRHFFVPEAAAPDRFRRGG